MSYDRLMQDRLERFMEVIAVLPDIREVAAELLVLSAGEEVSKWSYRHIPMNGVTYHFIFRKAGFSDGATQLWECVDRELNDIMEKACRRSA